MVGVEDSVVPVIRLAHRHRLVAEEAVGRVAHLDQRFVSPPAFQRYSDLTF